MTTYRWNTDSAARAYDASAEHIHPHYVEVQDQILLQLEKLPTGPLLIVDVGGGSGRLLERILDRFPNAEGILLDQSEPYLALAEQRLNRFGLRARVTQARLQNAWDQHLPRPANAIVSTSAIHHLDQDEKKTLYGRCYDYLAPSGILLNGDEVRPESDSKYLAELQLWSNHMVHELESGTIAPDFKDMINKWQHRNIEQFGAIRKSGEDCHEAVATQLDYLRGAGFTRAEVKWQNSLWALMTAQKLVG